MSAQLVCCRNTDFQNIQPQSLPETSPAGDALIVAQKIMQFVHQVVLYSPNNPNRSPELRAITSAEEQMRRVVKINNTLGAIYDKINRIIQGKVLTFALWFEHIVPLVQRYQVGNCSEMAAVGLQYAIDHSVIHRVEMFSIEGGDSDHVFLVIGRDPQSQPSDYRSWGAAAVCDPWASSCFYAKEIENRLVTAVRKAPYVMVTKPFDPAIHRLNFYDPDAIYYPFQDPFLDDERWY